MITLKSELEALKFDYEKKLQGLTEETSIFKQEAARRELDIELYINELYNKLKVICTFLENIQLIKASKKQ